MFRGIFERYRDDAESREGSMSGDWTFTIERSDRHGFWSIAFDGNTKLMDEIVTLARKRGAVIQKDMEPLPRDKVK